MELSAQVLAELLSMVKSRKGKKTLAQKIADGECLQCEKKADGCRGLCSYHENQMEYARDKAAESVALTDKEKRQGITLKQKVKQFKEAWTKEQVDKGLVLASRQGKHTKRTENPFMKTA